VPGSKLSAVADILDYQIGSTWGKSIIKQDSLENSSPAIRRAAKATARVRLGFGGATAFAIGQRGDQVLMATNHHVIGSEDQCQNAGISFEMLGISSLQCDRIIETSTDLDLTIFTISGTTAEQVSKIVSVAKSFNKDEPRKGRTLATIGYGVAGNPGQRNLMKGLDEDCKIFSPDGESRFMADPDEFNPGPHMTWMFAIGCDVSHGDSGSAIVDRESGDVIGIVSTGKIPKDVKVRESTYLSGIYDAASEDVWKELTYAVPASKIWELLGSALEQPK
jgi:hypothetical protein